MITQAFTMVTVNLQQKNLSLNIQIVFTPRVPSVYYSFAVCLIGSPAVIKPRPCLFKQDTGNRW